MLGLDRPPAADAEGSSAMARGAAAAAAGGAGDSDEEEAKEQVNAQDAAAVTRRPQRPAPRPSAFPSRVLLARSYIYIYVYNRQLFYPTRALISQRWAAEAPSPPL
jgi:hypothetical protein